MGDGKRLKELLDEKGMTVAQLARETTINNQTIYTMIKRDANIRFDFALRIANVLGIDPGEICSDSSFSNDDNKADVLPAMPSGLNSILDDNRVKRYMNNALYPLMTYYGKDHMPEVDKLLTYYYQLTDEGRQEVIKYVEERLALKKDPDRAKDVKNIKRW